LIIRLKEIELQKRNIIKENRLLRITIEIYKKVINFNIIELRQENIILEIF
jgi:hypothetical protein